MNSNFWRNNKVKLKILKIKIIKKNIPKNKLQDINKNTYKSDKKKIYLDRNKEN